MFVVYAHVYYQAYTMDANEAQEEYEEVQIELRKKEEEVSIFNFKILLF